MVKKIYLGIAIFTLILYFCASFLYDAEYVLYIKPFIIPCFLNYVLLSSNFKVSKRFLAFVLFFYLGDCCILYMNISNILYSLGLFFYFLSYLSMVFLVLPFIRTKSIIYEIKPYSIFTFFLIVLILAFVILIIFDQEINLILNFVIILNAFSALLLAIFAFIYLQQNFCKKSIFYFFGGFTIFFSDILSALQVYYLESFGINFVERILHFLGFYLIYLFYIENSSKTSSNLLE